MIVFFPRMTSKLRQTMGTQSREVPYFFLYGELRSSSVIGLHNGSVVHWTGIFGCYSAIMSFEIFISDQKTFVCVIKNFIVEIKVSINLLNATSRGTKIASWKKIVAVHCGIFIGNKSFKDYSINLRLTELFSFAATSFILYSRTSISQFLRIQSRMLTLRSSTITTCSSFTLLLF